jgi:hypothetical protein
MTGIISLAKLMEWKAMVERLNRQYQGCWGLVAAAEDRGRGVHGQEACQGEAGDRPRARRRVLRDKDYWSERVHVPAIGQQRVNVESP